VRFPFSAKPPDPRRERQLAKRVFISYRREDTAPVARLIYDRLWRVLSKANVFFDVSTIAGGEDFQNRIATGIGKSDATLVLIGDGWLKETPERKIRIWDDNDYVRAEVRESLARPMLLLPILVAGAHMPKPEQLPEDIRAIVTKNALPLRHESFDDDAENILSAITGVSARERNWEKQNTIWSRILYTAGGVVAAAVVLFFAALIHFALLDRPLSASIGVPMTVLMAVATVIAGGWLGFFRAKRR
jgi:TIR domain